MPFLFAPAPVVLALGSAVSALPTTLLAVYFSSSPAQHAKPSVAHSFVISGSAIFVVLVALASVA